MGKPTRPKAQEASSPAGREIIASITEFLELVESGVPLEDHVRIRVIALNIDPPPLAPDAIKGARLALKLSQENFARFLGVDVPTLRSWERGKAEPSPTALQFLGAIADDPAYWRARIDRAFEVVSDSRPSAGPPPADRRPPPKRRATSTPR